MKTAVLFDGGGLARLGLERAGLECTGFELDPVKHYLSQMVGSGNSVLADVRDVDLAPFEAIWASPPCPVWSEQNHGTVIDEGLKSSELLWWSLDLVERFPDKVIWIENVLSRDYPYQWGKKYNAVQFLQTPIQKRRRMIGGRYKEPATWRKFQYDYPELDVCPAVMASEYQAGNPVRTWQKERYKASRWYGRRLTPQECAYHQGFDIPPFWWILPPCDNPEKGKPYTLVQWRQVIYEAIGNGVPVYMARGFGEAYTRPDKGIRQRPLFEMAQTEVR